MISLTLRHVRDEDIIRFWRWWADPETRRFNTNLEPLTWDVHLKWFCEHMGCRHWYVGELAESGPVGAIRFEQEAGCGPFIVSVVVDPLLRKAGLGTALIALATAHMEEAEASALLVQARIHRFNTASERAFEKAGYVRVQDVAPWLWLEHRRPAEARSA